MYICCIRIYMRTFISHILAIHLKLMSLIILYITDVFSLLYLVITIKFSQSDYIINEKNGSVQPVLIFSNISLIEFTVQVYSINGSATGKFATP